MASNNITTLSPTDLPRQSARMAAQVAAHADDYPMMGETLTDALAAGTQTLNAATGAEVVRLAYASPLTPGLIAGLGLSPRSGSRARVVPLPPQELVPRPQVDGDVRLEWASATPGKRVRFIVEGQAADGGWAYLIDVGARRVTLPGYAPGVPAAFRVRASANGRLSAPSNAPSIYPAAPALRAVEGGGRKAA